MIEAGYLIEQCYHCGYDEKRSIDGKLPLLMFFKDGNKNNFQNGNAQMSCYNCYFLNIGKVFNEKDIEKLEGHSVVYNTTEASDFQLDDYHKRKLAIDPFSLSTWTFGSPLELWRKCALIDNGSKGE